MALLWTIVGAIFFLSMFSLIPVESNSTLLDVVIRGFGGILPIYLGVKYGLITEESIPFIYMVLQPLAIYASILVKEYRKFKKQKLIDDINEVNFKISRNIKDVNSLNFKREE